MSVISSYSYCCRGNTSSSNSSDAGATSTTSYGRKVTALLVLLVLWIVKSVYREDQRIIGYSSSSSSSSSSNHNAKQQKQQPQQKQRHPHWSDFEHFLVHIPKSGGSYAFDVLMEWLMQQPEWIALGDSSGTSGTSTTSTPRRMVCDGRTRPTVQFETYYPYSFRDTSSSSNGKMKKLLRQANSKNQNNHNHNNNNNVDEYDIPCNFWMAEQPTTQRAQHNYILVRSPRAHILSQYFHCKESFDHWDRWKYMPSLTEWLEAWVLAKNQDEKKWEKTNNDNDKNGTTTTATTSTTTTSSSLAADNSRQFHCYDPRNLQSRYAGVSHSDTDIQYYTVGGSKEAKAEVRGHSDTNNNNNNNNNNSTTSTSSTTASIADQLKNQFTVVGDNARMHASLCLIFIRYTNGWIPPSCDCSNENGNDNDNDNNSARRRQLKLKFYAHGVRHHGSSYPTNAYQDLLLDQLMDVDQPLYEAAQTLLQEQIEQVEQEYGIQICE